MIVVVVEKINGIQSNVYIVETLSSPRLRPYIKAFNTQVFFALINNTGFMDLDV